MLSTSEFLPMIRPYAAGVPDFVSEHCVRLAAIEFCERTRCWRAMTTVTTDEFGAAVLPYQFYAAIHEIEFAYFEGTQLKPTQFSEIDHGLDAADPSTAGVPIYITQVGPDRVTVWPFAAGSLKLSLFLKPRNGQSFGDDIEDPLKDAYNIVPDFMLEQHGENIAYGALARILAIPGEKFSDPNAAAIYANGFEEYCQSKFNTAVRGQQRASRRTTFVDF